MNLRCLLGCHNWTIEIHSIQFGLMEERYLVCKDCKKRKLIGAD